MHLKTGFSNKEHTDSGLALILILLILGFLLKHETAFKLALGITVIILIVPKIIYPFTFLWLNISELMGRVMSKIILAVIFFVFVNPVAFFRKALGKDTLRLKRFKKDKDSVFTERNHEFTKTDFTVPY